MVADKGFDGNNSSSSNGHVESAEKGEPMAIDAAAEYDPDCVASSLHPHLTYLSAYFDKLVTGDAAAMRSTMTHILNSFSALDSAKANGLFVCLFVCLFVLGRK